MKQQDIEFKVRIKDQSPGPELVTIYDIKQGTNTLEGSFNFVDANSKEIIRSMVKVINRKLEGEV